MPSLTFASSGSGCAAERASGAKVRAASLLFVLHGAPFRTDFISKEGAHPR